nr:hypothetical protein CFP56_54944 [Quercus suber]
MDGTISPPPSKRRKVSGSAPATAGCEPADLVIYSWNINGITPFLQKPITSFFARQADSVGTHACLRDVLRRHSWPSLFFLQEVKIAPGDTATVRAVQKVVRAKEQHDEPDYHAEFCLPTDRYNARGFGRKIYGVCCIVRKDFHDSQVARVRPVEWDEEGRFLVVETRATKTTPKLAIFNVYAVNGTDHPYRDSRNGEIVGTRHDRKLAVHKLLAAEVRALEADGFGVVVAGDINVARSTLDGHPNLRTVPHQHCLNRKDFERRFILSRADGASSKTSDECQTTDSRQDDHRLGMIDTFRHLHPDTLAYTYHPRGMPFGSSCDRVDMILVSSSLRGSIVEAKILDSKAEKGPSDHVPLMTSFRFDTMAK